MKYTWSTTTRKKMFIGVVLLTVLVLGAASSYYILAKPRDLSDIRVVKDLVSKHYVLPGDEQPALVTVTDKSKLTTPFLKKADNGDRVLLYQANQLAIIYRPGIDRIVGVGIVSIDSLPAKNQ